MQRRSTPCSRDPQARVVRALTGQQDLSGRCELIRAAAARPAAPPIDPDLLMTLWLNATLDGAGFGARIIQDALAVYLKTGQLPPRQTAKELPISQFVIPNGAKNSVRR